MELLLSMARPPLHFNSGDKVICFSSRKQRDPDRAKLIVEGNFFAATVVECGDRVVHIRFTDQIHDGENDGHAGNYVICQPFIMSPEEFDIIHIHPSLREVWVQRERFRSQEMQELINEFLAALDEWNDVGTFNMVLTH